MLIVERGCGDRDRLRVLIRAEKDAEQRDRLLCAWHALGGEEAAEIAAALCRSRRFVQRWAYADRDGGIDALAARPRGGDTPRLHGAAAASLAARLDAGATAGDRVCTLRGKDVQRIIKEELGTDLSLSSVYRTLERMGYSCLAPRPRHEKQDLEAQTKFKQESAPLL
jgi:transposase